MKPLKESTEYISYMTGQEMLSHDFIAPDGLRVFGEIVWEDHLRDLVTAQFDLEGELHWKKVHPVELDLRTPEQKRLQRPVEMKKGISKLLSFPQPEYPTEEQRLQRVREELGRINLNERG